MNNDALLASLASLARKTKTKKNRTVEQIKASEQRRARKNLADLAKLEAEHPALAEYWRGSIGCSVEQSVAAGEAVYIDAR